MILLNNYTFQKIKLRQNEKHKLLALSQLFSINFYYYDNGLLIPKLYEIAALVR